MPNSRIETVSHISKGTDLAKLNCTLLPRGATRRGSPANKFMRTIYSAAFLIRENGKYSSKIYVNRHSTNKKYPIVNEFCFNEVHEKHLIKEIEIFFVHFRNFVEAISLDCPHIKFAKVPIPQRRYGLRTNRMEEVISRRRRRVNNNG